MEIGNYFLPFHERTITHPLLADPGAEGGDVERLITGGVRAS
jgi:hypothetical protein